MTTSIEYLEAAKIEEVASQLRGDGYEVTVSPDGPDDGYDIVARKGDKKVAVEVKVNSQLRDSAPSIKTLRRRALEHGYDEFRLVVVSPPREVKVSVEKLEDELFKYMEQNLPAILGHSTEIVEELGFTDEVSRINIVGVGEIGIDSLSITKEGVQVVGTGVAEIEIDHSVTEQEPFHSAGFPPQDETSWTKWKTDVPFSFNVILNHELTISTVQEIEVDTSTLDG